MEPATLFICRSVSSYYVVMYGYSSEIVCCYSNTAYYYSDVDGARVCCWCC